MKGETFSMFNGYFLKLKEILDTVEKDEKENLNKAAQKISECIQNATRKDIRKSVLSFLEHLYEFPEKVLRLIGSMAMSEI
jgi:uncharacterized phosphosugar-binding protein